MILRVIPQIAHMGGSAAGSRRRGRAVAAEAGKEFEPQEDQQADQYDIHQAAARKTVAGKQGAQQRACQKAAEQTAHAAEQSCARRGRLACLGLVHGLALRVGRLLTHGRGRCRAAHEGLASE